VVVKGQEVNVTHGSSPSTPVNSISYATPGVAKFLETILNTDDHEFTAKMEGFALQGMKGTSLVLNFDFLLIKIH